MEQRGIRDKRPHENTSWVALRYIQATTSAPEKRNCRPTYRSSLGRGCGPYEEGFVREHGQKHGQLAGREGLFDVQVVDFINGRTVTRTRDLLHVRQAL